MSKAMITTSLLTDIANSIRSKTGKNNLMTPAEMPTEIESISGGSSPSGTKQITITENGTTTEDVTNYASAEITVNVQGSGSDALAEMLTNTLEGYTNNEISSLVAHAFADVTSLKNISLDSVTVINVSAFENCTNLESAKLGKARGLSNNCFYGCTKLTNIVLPSFKYSNTATLRWCSALKAVDLGNSSTSSSDTYIGQNVFANDTVLDTIVLRFPFVITLQNVNSFTSTPFASGGTGGTIYVPSSLISSYQAANNWATLHGYGTVTWQAIEGSQYENYHVDGTAV